MPEGKCTCGEKAGKTCPACMEIEEPGYWCEVCEQAVDAKRCPLCGLKTRKMRGAQGQKKEK
jgi:Zn ribbon nucleic-acid-binding protein